MKFKLLFFALLIFGNTVVNEPEGWEIFEKVVFKPTYFEEVDSYFDVPTFDPGLKALEGTVVRLSGYYVPFDLDTTFVLSGLPFSSCFFCGGAGPETVAEVRMKSIPDDLIIDEFVKIEGRLKLNATDIDYMNFIINDAKILK